MKNLKECLNYKCWEYNLKIEMSLEDLYRVFGEESRKFEEFYMSEKNNGNN